MENSQNSSKISLEDIPKPLASRHPNTAERLQWSETGRHELTRIETVITEKRQFLNKC